MVRNFGSFFRRWITYRKTLAELSKLSDRELSDLGITRWDIKDVARNAL